MKNLYLLFILIFGMNALKAQNPELFDTWYLKEIQIDINPTIFINEYEPAITPTLTINEDLSYEGIAACNSFSGNFTFNGEGDDMYFTEFISTDSDCETDELNQFEVIYSYLFSGDEHFSMWLWQNTQTGEPELWYGSSAGISYRFLKTPVLGNQNVKITSNPVYPNPASDFVMVQDAKLDLSYQILDINGKIVLDGKIRPEAKIDISALEKGIYILVIGNESFRFIKK